LIPRIGLHKLHGAVSIKNKAGIKDMLDVSSKQENKSTRFPDYFLSQRNCALYFIIEEAG